MVDEWHVAVRNRRRKSLRPALQPTTYTAFLADQPQTQEWAYSPRISHERLPASPLAEGSAALKHLQHQIKTRATEVTNSVFLHKFQRLLEHVQRQDLMHNTSEDCKLPDTFMWEATTELIVYGLGSPAAGDCHPLRGNHCCAVKKQNTFGTASA